MNDAHGYKAVDAPLLEVLTQIGVPMILNEIYVFRATVLIV